MCGGGGGGDGGAAVREAQRQAKIQEGYDKINAIFGGQKVYTGVNKVATPSDGQTYYDAQGNRVNYQGPQAAQYSRTAPQGWKGGFLGSLGGLGGNNDGWTYSAGTGGYHKAATPANYTGDLFSDVTETVTPGFDDAFYEGRAKAYTDFANPQLEDQYGKAKEQLLFALARNGRLDSSTRGNQYADLEKDFNIKKTDIASKGQSYANDARSAVERARSDLVAMNSAMADPTAAASQAAMAFDSLNSSPSFEALAPLFQNVGAGLSTQADLERRNAARYSTGIFNSTKGGSGRSIST